ncbi:MAG: hypothetical protein HDR25_03485, partial [Lachnospiraceae bacterium]|nr:hypothetical protein [Lachnospiraceae bacterium]
MIDTKFSIAHAAGRFDMALNIIDGNSQMFGLMGTENYFSLYKMMNTEEKQRVSDAA